MSMLARYYKSGGFVQLVQLIETCGKQKQDNFLGMIEKEDARWAAAVREKILTIEKVFGWDPTVLAEIAGRLQELTIATAMHGMKQEDIDRLLKTFTHSQRRNVEDLFKAKNPSTAEISSAFMKILQEVRSMITNGYLHLAKFAPELAIDDGIEDKLGKPASGGARASETVFDTPSIPAATSGATVHAIKPVPATGDAKEVTALRSQVHALTHENTTMKNELKLLREKLAQIKKIA